MNYDESTIEEIQAAYERGEFEQDDDPDRDARRRARERDQELDRERRRARSSRRLEHVRFDPAALSLGDQRTVADVELELIAGRHGYRAEPWTGPTGPMAVPEVADSPQRFRALIEAWERDPTGYLAELRRRGLVR